MEIDDKNCMCECSSKCQDWEGVLIKLKILDKTKSWQISQWPNHWLHVARISQNFTCTARQVLIVSWQRLITHKWLIPKRRNNANGIHKSIVECGVIPRLTHGLCCLMLAFQTDPICLVLQVFGVVCLINFIFARVYGLLWNQEGITWLATQVNGLDNLYYKFRTCITYS